MIKSGSSGFFFFSFSETSQRLKIDPVGSSQKNHQIFHLWRKLERRPDWLKGESSDQDQMDLPGRAKPNYVGRICISVHHHHQQQQRAAPCCPPLPSCPKIKIGPSLPASASLADLDESLKFDRTVLNSFFIERVQRQSVFIVILLSRVQILSVLIRVFQSKSSCQV